MQRLTSMRTSIIASMAVLASVSLSVAAEAQTFINPTINDGSFETPVLSAPGYSYSPTTTPWTFSGGAGISVNSAGAFAVSGPIPNGNQYAFLQVGSPSTSSTVSQSINLAAMSNLGISFSVAGRSNNGGATVFSASLDGTVFDQVVTSTSEAFTSQAFNLASVAAGSHTLTFTATGISGAGSDNTALLDNVNVVGGSLAAPEPGALALLATACPFMVGMVYRRIRH